MTKLTENKIEELYFQIMDKHNQILEVFNDFFGEDRVDMQGCPSLDEFKLYMKTAPILNYIPQQLLRKFDENIISKELTLNTAEESMLTKILNTLEDPAINIILANILFSEGFILVHFPRVRITNEYDKFVDIKHLYAKIYISSNGTMLGPFGLNRADYPYQHFESNYMHSHVSTIPKHNPECFEYPCLGQGPIKNTLLELSQEFNLDKWALFCLELDKYVQVESIAGTPYHRLENIGVSRNRGICEDFRVIRSMWLYNIDLSSLLAPFISYFIKQGKLKFSYRNGSYFIGMSYTEYILNVSNAFIEWYNTKFNEKKLTHSFAELKTSGIIQESTIIEDRIYFGDSLYRLSDYTPYNGQKICTFKGKDILLNIHTPKININPRSIILNPNIALHILTSILYILNCKYGKTTDKYSKNGISEKIRYI